MSFTTNKSLFLACHSRQAFFLFCVAIITLMLYWYL